MTVGDLNILLTSRAEILEPQQHTTDTGLQVPDWSQQPDSLGVWRCAVQHRSGEQEMTNARAGSVSKFRMYFDPDAPVRKGQRVLWGGQTLETVGVPRVVYDHLRAGQPHHLEVQVEMRLG